MIFTGWFLVNTLGPVFLPIAGLIVLGLLPLPGPLPTLRVMTTVKDGQLCWSVIAMRAPAIYELWEGIEAHGALPGWAGVAFAATIVLMLPAMLLAAGGAVLSTTLLTAPAEGLVAWMRQYRVFVSSAIMTVIEASIYTALHFAAAFRLRAVSTVGKKQALLDRVRYLFRDQEHAKTAIAVIAVAVQLVGAVMLAVAVRQIAS
jgi:hypothetical protein